MVGVGGQPVLGWMAKQTGVAKETACLACFHSSSRVYHQFQSTEEENVATHSLRVRREEGGSLRSILGLLCVAWGKHFAQLGAMQCIAESREGKKCGISMAGHGVWGSFAALIQWLFHSRKNIHAVIPAVVGFLLNFDPT